MRGHNHDPYRHRPLITPRLTDDVGEKPGRLRVLAFVDRYPPHVNAGAEWMLHTMMRWLSDQGHEAVVATATGEAYDFDGVHVEPGEQVAGLAASCDVIVGHLAWTRQAVELAAEADKPLVYLMHNDMQIGYWTLTPKNITAMVWNSTWVRDACPSWKGPGIVCRPPVDVDDYRIDEPAGDRVTLVNVNPEKGAHVFYEMAKRNPTRKFLGVAGAYGTQIRPPASTRNVETIRPTPNMRGDVYARTRVLLVPSSYESWGRVAVEAMCSGIPVIAHPTSGLIEALGDAGIFRSRDDPDAWHRALLMLDDPGRYAEWADAGRRRAADLWTTSVRVDLPGWETLLRRCAAILPGSAARMAPEAEPDLSGRKHARTSVAASGWRL